MLSIRALYIIEKQNSHIKNQYKIYRLAAIVASIPACAAFLVALVRGKGRRSFYLQGFLFYAVCILILSLIPAATAVIAFADSSLHWIWTSSSIREAGALRANVVYAYGPWFWIHVAYSHGLYVAGTFVVSWQFIGNFELYRRQAVLIVAATGFSLLFNAVYVMRIVPGLTGDFSSIAIAIAVTGILFTIGILRYGLLDLMPISRARPI